MTTLLLADERFLAHDPGPGHPERAERLRAVARALERPPAGAVFITPRPATEAELLRVHSKRYLDELAEAGRRGYVDLDPDTALSPGSHEAALLAAGGALQLVDEVAAGRADNGFALVRPPGHHARPGAAMGFCLLNNAAIAAEALLHDHGLSRVLVIDWDVHHGNGTQEAFWSRRDVLYFSTHRWPFYPGTGAVDEVGEGHGAGFTVNVPFLEGSTDADFHAAFRDVLLPIATQYAPQAIVVSAGFDAHVRDPLGGMRATEAGFADLCAMTRDLAAKLSGGRLVLLLEGGYDLDALAASTRACAEVLCGATAQAPGDGPTHAGGEAIREAIEVQRRFWRL